MIILKITIALPYTSGTPGTLFLFPHSQPPIAFLEEVLSYFRRSFFSFSFYPFSIRPSRSLNLSIALWSIISLQLRSLLSIIFPFLSRVINQTNSPPTLPQPHSIGARTPARIDQSVHRTRDKPTAGTILYARIPPLRSSVLYSSPSTLNLTWRWTVMTLFSYLG